MNASAEEAEAHAKQSVKENRVYCGNLTYATTYKDLTDYMKEGGWNDMSRSSAGVAAARWERERKRRRDADISIMIIIETRSRADMVSWCNGCTASQTASPGWRPVAAKASRLREEFVDGDFGDGSFGFIGHIAGEVAFAEIFVTPSGQSKGCGWVLDLIRQMVM
jgi:hypothetical protein